MSHGEMLEAALAVCPGWKDLRREIDGRMAGHGDMPRWSAALAQIPALAATSVDLGDAIRADGPATPAERTALEAGLRGLHPWRKGPFELFGVQIDSEWRSDLKWRRLAPHLIGLDGLTVLDVGAGNGYFGWRALQAGAERVIGIDPSVLFNMQHHAVCRCLHGGDDGARVAGRNLLLPVPFESLPPARFPVVMSMGVIYHRRDPAEHVARLHAFTEPGGQLVLETLVVGSPPDAPEGSPEALVPDGRYARMRNISIIPSIALLERWLTEAGFDAVTLVDLTPTTSVEQRRTDWMTFESLSASLDPDDPSLTVEGHPAPVRAMLTARRPC